MLIQGTRVLVLGGHGLVGRAIINALLPKEPAEIVIHSLHQVEADQAVEEHAPHAGVTKLTACSGDILGRAGATGLDAIATHIMPITNENLKEFTLYTIIQRHKPQILIDCVNTATAIAYRNVFKSAESLFSELQEKQLTEETAAQLLDALYIPRLIRHIQVLYRGMIDFGTKFYGKIGTTGTGGMGLNIPYTHSEEKPSRVLLSKSAMAGAHSMMLFLMGRTPGAPITKELKPAAAIAWKKIGYGPISRKGVPIKMVDARPIPLGSHMSTHNPDAAQVRDDTLQNVFIDTGENGIFSLEEFSALTTCEQMEFVTPEEIAQHLVFEVEGGNTGFDIIGALDTTIIGPSYRAGLMRHWALERMVELEQKHQVDSVAFEMLGPPRLSKLLFEAHLLRLVCGEMQKVRALTAQQLCDKLNRLMVEEPEHANRIAAIGVPILLEDGNLIRGPKLIVPPNAEQEPVTAEKLEKWVHDGWVDLRLRNCQRWIDRFDIIHQEIEQVPDDDTSSRYLRTERFWHDENIILPGKIAGWIFAVEEQGARMK
ncbi:MAG: short-chain dehydrogenase [Acidobacteria bacterium]|nr:short-chain dehydrogenase [Acidobacteriota bacterium]